MGKQPLLELIDEDDHLAMVTPSQLGNTIDQINRLVSAQRLVADFRTDRGQDR